MVDRINGIVSRDNINYAERTLDLSAVDELFEKESTYP